MKNILNTEFFINSILETNINTLKEICDNINECYTEFSIPKKDGQRIITAIDKNSELYKLQKNLCKNFLYKVDIPICVKGFVPGESYISFLMPHIGQKYFLRVDISSFFDSITKEIIIKTISDVVNDKDSMEYILKICTYKNRLPQGAVTSPSLSNIVFRQIDQRILKYCQEFDGIYKDRKKIPVNITYTRYADDLLFSSDNFNFKSNTFFRRMISKILKQYSFNINRSKIKMGIGQLNLSGYILENNIHLSRKKLKTINKIIYFFNKNKTCINKKFQVDKNIFINKEWIKELNKFDIRDNYETKIIFDNKMKLLDYLAGYRSFLISFIKVNFRYDNQKKQLCKKVNKIEQIIDSIIDLK